MDSCSGLLSYAILVAALMPGRLLFGLGRRDLAGRVLQEHLGELHLQGRGDGGVFACARLGASGKVSTISRCVVVELPLKEIGHALRDQLIFAAKQKGHALRDQLEK